MSSGFSAVSKELVIIQISQIFTHFTSKLQIFKELAKPVTTSNEITTHGYSEIVFIYRWLQNRDYAVYVWVMLNSLYICFPSGVVK